MAILAKVENLFQGKKTYIVAVLIALGFLARAKGIIIPEYVWGLLAATGLGAVRSAIGKVNQPAG